MPIRHPVAFPKGHVVTAPEWIADHTMPTEAELAAILNSRYCRIATGTYTGDGALSKAITGVGFQPKYVLVYGRVGTGITTYPYWTANYMVAGAACTFTVNQYIANRILSIDADGFTVSDGGTDADPNKNGREYGYLCLA